MGKAYAKVSLGLRFLLALRAIPCLWFFVPNTKQEDIVAAEIAAALEQYPDAKPSVSVECSGALRDLPVIGESPMVDLAKPDREQAKAISSKQVGMLEGLRDAGPMWCTYRSIQTASSLIRRGWAVRMGGKPAGETWIEITAAGLAVLGAK